MAQCWRGLMLAVAVVVSGSGSVFAADLDKATADAEVRRRTAENGAQAIRAKAPQDAEQVRAFYDEAAAANSAWLDATQAALGRGEVDAAVTDAAGKAASALLRWVAARNKALGETMPAARVVEAAEANIRQSLVDISTEFARKHGRADAKKKADVVADLSRRLRWKPWNEL